MDGEGNTPGGTDGVRGWEFGAYAFELGSFPLIMGIVNVTPDSFSDGGQFFKPESAIHHAMQLVEGGADILDIGAESTRPGAVSVSVDEELRRVMPVVREVAKRADVPISIDTTKAEIARQALDAGASIVNDISGLRFDPQMPGVSRDSRAGVICMHMQGTPQTMQENPQYDDVVGEICNFLSQRVSVLEQMGIPRQRIVLDPGIGFGKTAEHNLMILSNIRRFRALGRPILIGHSRKRFLAKVHQGAVDERSSGTLGVAVALAMQSTDIIRVHDVGATRDALLAWHAVASRIRPEP